MAITFHGSLTNAVLNADFGVSTMVAVPIANATARGADWATAWTTAWGLLPVDCCRGSLGETVAAEQLDPVGALGIDGILNGS